jgi:hypothetical protein
MELSPQNFSMALFLHDVLRAGRAWGFSYRDELIVIHRPNDVLLPLASNEEVAHGMQKRIWPACSVTALSIDDLLAHCLPAARKDGISICAAVCEEGELVTLPPGWLEKALRDLRSSILHARP